MPTNPIERFDNGGTDENGDFKPLSDFDDDGMLIPHNNFRVAHGGTRRFDQLGTDTTTSPTDNRGEDTEVPQMSTEDQEFEVRLVELAEKLGSYALAKAQLGEKPSQQTTPKHKAPVRHRTSRRGGRAYPEISGRDIALVINQALAQEAERLGRPLTEDESIQIAHVAELQARQQNG